jgi:hypothetical protein
VLPLGHSHAAGAASLDRSASVRPDARGVYAQLSEGLSAYGASVGANARVGADASRAVTVEPTSVER